MPTRLPHRASASARFTATVVLPTPPLPAPTAMTFFTPGSGGRPVSGADAERTLAVICTSTSETPGSARTAAAAWSRIWSFTGHAGVVSSMVNETRAAGDREVLHEAERHDVLAKVGVDDDAKRVEDRVAVRAMACTSSYRRSCFSRGAVASKQAACPSLVRSIQRA